MRVFIQSPDDRGRIDGSVQSNILDHFPEKGSSVHDADVVIVPIAFFSDYKFNPKLWTISEIGRPWVLIDFLEYEWCYFNEKTDTHLFGKNTEDCRWLNPNWYPFDEWVRNHPPILYFKRELLAKDASDTVKPIEWACYLPDSPIQSEEEFNKRRLEVYFNWGYSNPSRPKLHGDIFHGMNTNGLGVISENSQFELFFKEHPHARAWMSVFCPWYSRLPMGDVLFYQRNAKISVSLPGAGRKCFRSTEAPQETIMAMQADDLAWSRAWLDGINCIRLRPGHEFEDLERATKRDDLYEIYRKSQETIAQYRTPFYTRDYVAPLIEGAL